MPNDPLLTPPILPSQNPSPDMPPPDMPQQQQPSPQLDMGSGASTQQQSGPPKPSVVPALAGFLQQLAGGGGVGKASLPNGPINLNQAPQRPPSRLDAFENFVGNFLQSFSQGMSQGGTGPGANQRGFGAAAQAPYQQQLQQYQMRQAQQAQQAQVSGEQARTALTGSQTAGSDLENQIRQRTLDMMKGQGGAGDPIAALGPLTGDEKAVLGAAMMSGDPKARNAAVDKIANMRAVASRQQVGIGARQDLAKQTMDEKVREYKVTDDYRKWKENLDNSTKLNIANMSQSKAPAALMQTAVFAKGGLDRLADARAAMDELEKTGVMGSLPANKVQDYIFGKGLVDPSLDTKTRGLIGRMRAALGYGASAAMRAHTGRTSEDIYLDFKNRLGPGQDWAALRGAMGETTDMLTDYATAASDENIKKIRSGQNLTGGNGGGTTAPTADAWLKKYPPKKPN